MSFILKHEISTRKADRKRTVKLKQKYVLYRKQVTSWLTTEKQPHRWQFGWQFKSLTDELLDACHPPSGKTTTFAESWSKKKIYTWSCTRCGFAYEARCTLKKNMQAGWWSRADTICVLTAWASQYGCQCESVCLWEDGTSIWTACCSCVCVCVWLRERERAYYIDVWAFMWRKN